MGRVEGLEHSSLGPRAREFDTVAFVGTGGTCSSFFTFSDLRFPHSMADPHDHEDVVAHPTHQPRPPLLSRSSAAQSSRRTASSASSNTNTSSPSSSPLTAASRQASNALFGHPGYLPGVESRVASERVFPHESQQKFRAMGPSPRSPEANPSEEDEQGWLSQVATDSDAESDFRRGSMAVAHPPEFLLKTARFKHTVVDGKNFLLTGREGELVRCEDEVSQVSHASSRGNGCSSTGNQQPIHCPGAIQGFAVLIAFDALPDGRLVVVQVSEVVIPAPFGSRRLTLRCTRIRPNTSV